MYRALFVLFILISIISAFTAGEANNKFAVFVEGKETGYQSRIIDGIFYVPARILEKHYEAELIWYGILNLLEVNLDGNHFRMRENDVNMQFNQSVINIAPPLLINSTMWISLEEVLGPLGYVFTYSAADNCLHIDKEVNYLKKVSFNSEEQELCITSTGPFIFKISDKGPFSIKLLRIRKDLEFVNDFLEAEGGLVEEDGGAILYLDKVAAIKNIEESHQDEFELKVHFFSRLLDATYDENNDRIALLTEGKIDDYNVFALKEPERLVIDLNNIVLGNVNLLNERFRVSQYQHNPPIVRIVIPIAEESDYYVRQPDPMSLQVDLGLSNQISGLKWHEDKANKYLMINSSRSVEINKFLLIEPLRLVFDIPNSVLLGESGFIDVNDESIQRIRYSQFDQETVRIVLDLYKVPQISFDYLEEFGHQTKVNFLKKFKMVEIHYEEGVIKDRYHIDFNGPVDYSIHHLSSPDRVVIDIEETMADPEQRVWPGEGDMVKGFRLSQFSFEPYVMRIVLDLASAPIYKIITPEKSERITLEFTKNPLLGRTIVIDPGHGGFDPGACTPSGTYEKDIVLDIALRLKEMVQKAGAKVIMTRDIDEFISLWARAELANKVNADAFISIHANSVDREKREGATDIDPKGTETYVVPRCSPSTQKLAEAIHNQVLLGLGLFDRGIKQKNYNVLTPLQMPGILLEVAFLSNPVEEMLLKDVKIRQNAAEAILKGLNNYFSQLRLGER